MPRSLTRSAIAALAALTLSGCAARQESNSIVVQANDYAFTAPDSLPAGEMAIGLSNAGKVAHEIIVVRLKPNADVQQILRLDRADSSWAALRDEPSGILTADAGVTTPGRLLLNLQAGERYLMICNFRDSATAPAHLHLGMMKLVSIYGAGE